MSADTSRLPGSLPFQLLAYVLLAGDVFANYGLYHPATFVGLLLALGAVAAAAPERAPGRLPPWALPAALALTCAIQLGRSAGWYLGEAADIAIRAIAGVGALLAIAFGRAGPHARAWLFAALCALALAARLAVIAGSPSPDVDVWKINQRTAEGLLRGENPYALVFPGTEAEPGAPERTNPYPPLPNLLLVPGYLFAGDVRISLLLAEIAAIALLYALGRKRLRRAGRLGEGHAALQAVVLLWAFFPRAPLVVEVSWVEPLLVLLLAAFLYLEEAGRRWAAAVALGLFAASKQYLILILPLVLLVRRDVKGLTLAAVVAFAVTIPFVLWSPADFLEDTVLFHLHSPFREDGLTLSAFLWDLWGVRLPDAASLVAALAALALAAWRARGTAGFLHRSACVLLVFFLFSKHAFCNYYYFACALLAMLLCYGVTTPAGERQ